MAVATRLAAYVLSGWSAVVTGTDFEQTPTDADADADASAESTVLNQLISAVVD